MDAKTVREFANHVCREEKYPSTYVTVHTVTVGSNDPLYPSKEVITFESRGRLHSFGVSKLEGKNNTWMVNVRAELAAFHKPADRNTARWAFENGFQIRFDGPPGPVAGRFVEVEGLDGKSIGFGDWVQDGSDWLLVVRGAP